MEARRPLSLLTEDRLVLRAMFDACEVDPET